MKRRRNEIRLPGRLLVTSPVLNASRSIAAPATAVSIFPTLAISRARYERRLHGLVRHLLRLSSDIHTVADVSLVFLIEVNFPLFRGYNIASFFTVPVPVQEALEPGLHGLVILA